MRLVDILKIELEKLDTLIEIKKEHADYLMGQKTMLVMCIALVENNKGE